MSANLWQVFPFLCTMQLEREGTPFFLLQKCPVLANPPFFRDAEVALTPAHDLKMSVTVGLMSVSVLGG